MRRLVLIFISLPVWLAAANRYIVLLDEEPVATHVARVSRRGAHMMASPEARKHRSWVRARQGLARRDVELKGARVLEQVDTVANALLVDATAAQATELEQVAGVRRVVAARRFRPLLDHALPLHKVPDVWSQVGADNAGAGVKIAIIDTGIDIGHAGFQDARMTAPDGFPKVNNPDDTAFTNGKVIAARSYASMFEKTDPDPSARDNLGHGTAAAMVAAGTTNSGPLATISGVAPKAWLGSYKVFGTAGVNDGSSDDIILKAIDDAVADGMDVINLSLGGTAPALDLDPLVEAVENAAKAGVLVVVAAGNEGPDAQTISSPGSAPSVIAVGASGSDRLFSPNVSVTGGGAYVAIPGNGPAPASAVTGPLVDVEKIDGDGRACSTLPSGSLQGSIALILRGICTFEDKLLHAEAAGAMAAVVYSHQDSPDAVAMATGTAKLPAEMVSWSDGTAIKQLLSSPVQGTLQFTTGPVWIDPNRLANFSSRGPNVDGTIKPDLVAVGTYVYTAAQRSDPRGDVYDANGYAEMNGTSFSAPLVAGAAALVKAAHPGLTATQYKSLLVNSAAAASLKPGDAARVQQSGAGVLDAGTAARSTLAAAPVSLSFGSGGADAQVTRHLTLTNVGTAAETFTLTALPRDGAPAPALPGTVQLDPGASYDFDVTFTGAGLAPGAYEGSIAVLGGTSGVESRIPYWYAMGPSAPQAITVLNTIDTQRAGASVSILFRATDASGLAVTDPEPAVTMVSGGGSVARVRNTSASYPGAFVATVTLGLRAGTNVFRIQAGEVTKDVAIVAR
jgi:subtilisin family serine protease